MKHFCLQCKDRVKLQAFIEIATIPFWQVPSVFAFLYVLPDLRLLKNSTIAFYLIPERLLLRRFSGGINIIGDLGELLQVVLCMLIDAKLLCLTVFCFLPCAVFFITNRIVPLDDHQRQLII